MASVLPIVSVLSPRVIRILGCNPGPMTLQGTNTFVVGTGRRRVLVDTGEPKITEYTTKLAAVLREYNAELSHIIITHWHHDHSGGIDDLFETGIVRANADGQSSCKVFKIARDTEADDTLVTKGIRYNYVTDGHEISTEGASLTVLHTPGHTEDHLVLLLKEENAVFSGDCILGEGTTVFEDLHSYLASLKRIASLAPSRIYPGHGPVIETDCLDRIEAYIAHRLTREKQILQVLQSDTSSKHYTPLELVKIIYKDTPEHLHMAAAFNVTQHLEKLLKDDVVVKSNDKWSLKEIRP